MCGVRGAKEKSPPPPQQLPGTSDLPNPILLDFHPVNLPGGGEERRSPTSKDLEGTSEAWVQETQLFQLWLSPSLSSGSAEQPGHPGRRILDLCVSLRVSLPAPRRPRPRLCFHQLLPHVSTHRGSGFSASLPLRPCLCWMRIPPGSPAYLCL